MDLESYIIIVALAAIVYSLIARKIQYKYGKQKEMEELQKKSKMLNERYAEASKRNDKQEMEEIMKKQMEVMSRMWGMLGSQFYLFVPIIVLFIAFTWATSYLDPTTADDITIELNDDGTGCDEKDGDGIFTGCYELTDSNHGTWVVHATAYLNDNVVGKNSTAFLVGGGSIDKVYKKKVEGSALGIITDKESYVPGELVKIFAVPEKGTTVTAVLDHGTAFYVDLPVTIPLIEVKRITEPYWWFIFVSIITGLIISFTAGKVGWKK